MIIPIHPWIIITNLVDFIPKLCLSIVDLALVPKLMPKSNFFQQQPALPGFQSMLHNLI